MYYYNETRYIQNDNTIALHRVVFMITAAAKLFDIHVKPSRMWAPYKWMEQEKGIKKKSIFY